MRPGVKFVSVPNPPAGAPHWVEPVMGIPIRFDPSVKGVAEAHGFGRWVEIRVNQSFFKLPPAMAEAVLVHEAKHCRSFHREQRYVLLALMVAPVLLLPWQFILAALLFMGTAVFIWWWSERQEYDADRFAFERGHGQALAQFISLMCQHQQGDFFHPSHHDRTARLEKLMKEKRENL